MNSPGYRSLRIEMPPRVAVPPALTWDVRPCWNTEAYGVWSSNSAEYPEFRKDGERQMTKGPGLPNIVLLVSDNQRLDTLRGFRSNPLSNTDVGSDCTKRGPAGVPARHQSPLFSGAGVDLHRLSAASSGHAPFALLRADLWRRRSARRPKFREDMADISRRRFVTTAITASALGSAMTGRAPGEETADLLGSRREI